MPPGLTADLRGITYCPDAAIAAAAQSLGRAELAHPSCPASSEIGTSNVAAGPGSHPFHAVGKMYLAGPFKGAPLSVVAITPALAGPYDYGTVVVRVAINVDQTDAHVVAVSDTVPSIIGGIPIRMRSIQVNIDRPNFMINPTNCDPFSVESQGIGDEGTVADFSSFFEAVNCRALAFKPKMTIRQLGGSQARRSGRGPEPAVRPDDAAGRRQHQDAGGDPAESLRDRPAASGQPLLEVGAGIANVAPAASRSGSRGPKRLCSTSRSKGPAYAVSGFGGLPHVVFILDGQVSLLPQSQSTTVNGGELRTEVPSSPTPRSATSG